MLLLLQFGGLPPELHVQAAPHERLDDNNEVCETNAAVLDRVVDQAKHVSRIEYGRVEEENEHQLYGSQQKVADGEQTEPVCDYIGGGADGGRTSAEHLIDEDHEAERDAALDGRWR